MNAAAQPLPTPVLTLFRVPGRPLPRPLPLRPGDRTALQIAERDVRDTLAAWLRGDSPPEAGALEILGRDPAAAPVVPGAGRVPQVVVVAAGGGLLDHLNVWENVWMPAAYHRPAEETRLVGRIAAVLDRLGLAPERDARRRAGDLAPAERFLVGFARALLLEPEVIVLDSVFEGLDPGEHAVVPRALRAMDACLPFRALLALGAQFPDDWYAGGARRLPVTAPSP